MTIYAIVNLKAREEFEKKYQIPFGYSNCPLFYSFKEAMFFFDDINGSDKGLVVEKCESGSKKVVYV